MEANNQFSERYRSFWNLLKPILCYNLGSLFFGFSCTYFNLIDFKEIQKLYHINMEEKIAEGIYSGCMSFGAIFGALMSSFLISKISRKHNFYVANTLSFIAGVLILFENMYTLLFGRILQGICTGIYTSIITLTVKEFSPVEASGSLGAIKLTMNYVGCLLPTFLVYFVNNSETSIKIFFSVILIFPFLQQILLMLFYSFETPKYYLMNGRIDECRSFIEQFYQQEYWDEVLQDKVNDLEVEMHYLEEGEQVEQPKDNWKAIFIAFFMQFFMQLCGINIFAVYNREIAAQFYPSFTIGFPIALHLIRFGSSLLASFLLKEIGRKKILIFGLVTEFFLGTLFWALLHYGYEKGKVSGFIILMVIMFIIAIFAFSISTICWLYIPEVIQPSLVPFTTLTNWIYTCAFVTFYPMLIKKMEDFEKVGIMMMCGTLISAILVKKMSVQTRGKTQLEIREEFNMKSLC